MSRDIEVLAQLKVKLIEDIKNTDRYECATKVDVLQNVLNNIAMLESSITLGMLEEDPEELKMPFDDLGGGY